MPFRSDEPNRNRRRRDRESGLSGVILRVLSLLRNLVSADGVRAELRTACIASDLGARVLLSVPCLNIYLSESISNVRK
jgi:hypothetical protein